MGFWDVVNQYRLKIIGGRAVDSANPPTYTEDDAVVASIDKDTGAILTKSVGGGGAGGTQYQEDTAHVSGDTGTLALVVRKDAAASIAGADGDYTALQVDANGALRVAGVAAANTEYTEDAAAAANPVGIMSMARRRDTLVTNEVSADGDNIALNATNKGQLHVFQETQPARDAATDDVTIYAQFDDASTSTPAENGLAALRITEQRGLHINLRNNAGAETGVAAVPLQVSLANTGANATAVKVDGSAVTQPVSAASLPLPTGASTAANQTTGNTSLASIDGKITACNTGAVTIAGGNVAHDAVDSGSPVKVGFKAETSPKGITLVADGDRTDGYADADGLQMVKLNTSGADVLSDATSNTDGNSTASSIFTAVASTKNYITAFQVFRTDAGTTPIYIDFRDGTAGSVLWRAVLPPNGGSNSPACAGPALFKTSANTALAYDVSAATSTVYINVSGYQSKV